MSDKLPELVLDALRPELEPLGFKLVKSKQCFTSGAGDLIDRFKIVILTDSLGYRLCPSVGIRFELVESIFHRTSGYCLEYQKDTSTLGVDLFAVYGKPGYQLRLRDKSDIHSVSSRLMEIFRDRAAPYFVEYSTLDAVDSAVNGRPYERCVHRVMPILRCSTGAIVAKLVGRKDYDHLISIYRAALQKFAKGFYLPRFELLLADLATMKG